MNEFLIRTIKAICFEFGVTVSHDSDKIVIQLQGGRLGNAQEVIQYLNEIAGTSYKATSKQTIKLINARLAEDYTIEDFKKVIYSKTMEWKSDPKYSKYLRPSTLFSPKHFEEYLSAASIVVDNKMYDLLKDDWE
jgi:uncharacterized phage protein (TIGR02220 family)